MKENIIIATIKQWNKDNINILISKYKNEFNFILIDNPEKLIKKEH